MNTSKDNSTEDRVDLSPLAEAWNSPYVERQQSYSFTCGAYEAKTMANYDSKQEGPAGRIKIGKKVLYPVNEFIKWLELRASKPKRRRLKPISDLED